MFRRLVPSALAGIAALAAITVLTTDAAAQQGAAAATPVRPSVTVLGAVHHVRAGRAARVRLRVTGSAPGVPVRLQRRVGAWRWRTVAVRRLPAGRRLTLRWQITRPGRYAVRALAAGARARVGAVTAYRQTYASWYGPGLYGSALACGGHLTPSTLGVAHKTLPCGAKVTVRAHGRSVRVPVIDRGPYVAGREYDLTAAVRNRIGFDGVGAVLVSR